MVTHQAPLSSWGRLQSAQHRVVMLDAPNDAVRALNTTAPGIAHGLGRSYGDVALNPGGTVWKTTGMNRFLGFDRDNGVLHCESGLSLYEIQRVILPQGWSLPVIPGTQHVTVGGAIANDVHGKNHHRYGSFGNQVKSLTLQRSSGERLICSPHENGEYFRASIGGLGLTGLILDARLQLRRMTGGWLDTQTLPFTGLDEFFTLARESEPDWEYTVAWIDCVARQQRGIVMRANHAQRTDWPRTPTSPKSVHLTPPVSIFNRLTLRTLNTAYFYLKSRAPGQLHQQPLQPFFYPLDALADWNRLYGPRGFYQYQCVLPQRNGREAIADLLARIAASGEGSFLAVLKTFGYIPAQGMLSFPQPGGVTLALDFPNRGQRTLSLFERLDVIVATAGGRLYPAKDARMPAALFAQGYPRLEEFIPFRDPAMSSAMSRRLLGKL